MYKIFGLHKKDEGFTLAEILIVIAIVGVLAAIALPAVLNQRTQAVESGMQADLLGASSSLDLVLTTWRGVPPAEVAISTSDSRWQAVVFGQTDSVASGGVSEGTDLSGTIWDDGSYCISASNPVTNGSLIFRSDERNAVPGTCPTSAIGGVGTLPGTVALDLPSMPGSLVVASPSDNTISVSWAEVEEATSYTVSVAGVASQEILAPLTSATFTQIPPGTLTVVVYAQNTNGAGPGAYGSVAVSGTIEYALSSRLNSYTYSVANQTEKTTIAGQTAGSTVWVAEDAWSETWTGADWVITGGVVPFTSVSRATDLLIPDNAATLFVGTVSENASSIEEDAGVFTIPRDGKYSITFSLILDNANNIGQRSAAVVLNETTTILLSSSPATTNFDSHLSGSRTLSLLEGDTIALQIFQSSGDELPLLGSSSSPAYLDISYVAP